MTTYSNSNTAKELKEACRVNGLQVSGNKQKLLDRLQGHFGTAQPSTSASNKRSLDQTEADLVREQHIEAERRRQIYQVQLAANQQRAADQAAAAQAAREAAVAQAARDKAETQVVEAEMNGFYKRYDDAEFPGEIRDDGIQKLGEDMEVDIMSDVVFLALLHKMAPQTPGRITKEEFTKGMQTLKCSSVSKLKAIKPSLDPGFLTRAEFKELYKFIFHFNRETRDVKNIPKEIVTALLPIAMGDRSEHVADFVEFLEAHDEIKQVNMDGWMGFLEFTNTVGKDFDEHDAEGAWPVLIDDFVEYKQNRINIGRK